MPVDDLSVETANFVQRLRDIRGFRKGWALKRMDTLQGQMSQSKRVLLPDEGAWLCKSDESACDRRTKSPDSSNERPGHGRRVARCL